MSAITFPQDYVVYNNLPPLSTVTQLYDASRVLEKNSARSYYFGVSTLITENANANINTGKPKFLSDQDRMLYKIGQFSYLSPR